MSRHRSTPAAPRPCDSRRQEGFEELVGWIDAHTCHDCQRHNGCPAWHAVHRAITALLATNLSGCPAGASSD